MTSTSTDAHTSARNTGRRYVYRFTEGSKDKRDLLGGKGANLAEMTRLGLTVPPGFTITTEACRDFLALGERPDGLEAQVAEALAELEEHLGRRLDDADDPLLVSVRSGAAFSMPGMMDTVLDLGLTDRSVEGLAKQTADPRFAWDAYRRLIQLFGKVVMGVPGETFEGALNRTVTQRGLSDETELGADDLQRLAGEFKEIIQAETGESFPQDPGQQLWEAIEAVFRSWNGRRARDYRRLEGIPDDLGTAVNVQAMVFGNLGDDSGTGVAFTRNPSTGEPEPYGDWLPGAQGEDVVAGIRRTQHLDRLAERFSDCHAELLGVMRTLERHYRDLCDIEFTIERGQLYILQTRVGKRTARAALRIAADMVSEGLINEGEAVLRVSPEQLEQLLHPQFAPDAEYETLAQGLEASPGAATGRVSLSADEAEARAAAGEAVILVRSETAPDDLHGMIAAQGILTSRGGLVSHAAVVARGMGKPAVCGVGDLHVDLERGVITIGDTVIRDGDVISINGSTGEVVLGEVPVVVPRPDGPFDVILGWADRFRRLGVRANADTPEDAERARANGAEGVGLCRTEHMFLGDRLPIVQRMILAADDTDEEAAALAELHDRQREDFIGLLQAMDGFPVTVRLLDPPLHEFLPDIEELVVSQARGELDEAGERLLSAARDWQEVNPMLGVRGCRLGILKPELYRMQTRALLEAAVEVKRSGGQPEVEIMIPLVATAREFSLIAGWVRDAADEVLRAAGERIAYTVGTMIETPRAALTAGQIAHAASFFSFGTNDLTQMTFGFSRDDVAARIMPRYIAEGLLPVDPFQSLDADGVGRLMRLAATEGRAARPDLTLGVCGEHGADPASVRLCDELGLDYVSCSPYRVPLARLAAAHAALGASGQSASV